jgi:hypothetical protein
LYPYRRRLLLLPPAVLLLVLSPLLLSSPPHTTTPIPLHLVPPPERPPHPPSHDFFHPHALPPLHILLDYLSLASLPDEPQPTYQQHNARAISALSHCVSSDRETCKIGQTDVLLVGTPDFAGSVYGGWTGGEAVWAGSVVRSAQALGYTVVFSTQLEETMEQYNVLGEYVKGEGFLQAETRAGSDASQAQHVELTHSILVPGVWSLPAPSRDPICGSVLRVSWEQTWMH